MIDVSGAMDPTYVAFVEEFLDRHPEVRAVRMWGVPSLRAPSGKSFGGCSGDDAFFKLPPAEHAQAMALPGAHALDPSGKGRPLKEWVVVSGAHAALWPVFAEAGLAYVGGG